MKPELAEFCEAEYPRLVGMLGLHCADRAVAEELAQETLARAWRHWSKVQKMDKPSAWVAKVAMNLANSHLRRIAAERRATQRLGVADPVHDDLDVASRADVRKAVARLPRRQKTALILRYYLGLTFREAADVMQVPEATVKSLARRALARLREDEALSSQREALDVT